ncbi:DUF2721 domain-containing protein [Persicirhabdus sediminis]|uniref:DUF2721 domain-containing protein n=1 Tax=Persicirhabdus sediminis TaxID=454144 RepID=A0A8J7SIG5_9BACT|nr:DUF2721 domain-containing protein [Persicirhabdus sediminis]MBK1791445.1 DUF2721 domain-containing protein [Persicirhabdus sediminis]
MTLTTPALLFPAISLLLLAYTNRFLVLAQLIRELNGKNKAEMRELIVRQIANLKKRLMLIKLMQGFGVFSFILCTFSMFCIFLEFETGGKFLFGASLISLAVSLICSLYEVIISMIAINVELESLEL